jgi:hypothetical protein
MTERPVSWFLIEKGLRAVGRDGEELGEVSEVLGDEEHDIFDGLMVRSSLLGSSHYVPAERVGTITTGHVELDLDGDELGTLDAEAPDNA